MRHWMLRVNALGRREASPDVGRRQAVRAAHILVSFFFFYFNPMVVRLFILQGFSPQIKLFIISYSHTMYNDLHQCTFPVTKVNSFSLTLSDALFSSTTLPTLFLGKHFTLSVSFCLFFFHSMVCILYSEEEGPS